MYRAALPETALQERLCNNLFANKTIFGGAGEMFWPCLAVLSSHIVPGLTVRSVVEWVLASPVQFICGARFYK